MKKRFKLFVHWFPTKNQGRKRKEYDDVLLQVLWLLPLISLAPYLVLSLAWGCSFGHCQSKQIFHCTILALIFHLLTVDIHFWRKELLSHVQSSTFFLITEKTMCFVDSESLLACNVWPPVADHLCNVQTTTTSTYPTIRLSCYVVSTAIWTLWKSCMCQCRNLLDISRMFAKRRASLKWRLWQFSDLQKLLASGKIFF